MKLLVIGGTVFLGRAFVECALSAGHEVALFHRGQHGADLFPSARHIFGDRDGGLSVLGDEQWDAVVDCCGYFPRIVRGSAEYLADKVDRYLFVSTISVYASPAPFHQDESAPVGTIEDPTFEEITGESYGPLKALCEDAVRDVLGERALVIRPGLIAGPFDPSNRFTYWADRAAAGGPYIGPPRTDQPLQIIDVRDLAAFMLLAVEKGLSGTYNATGPSEASTFGDLVEELSAEWPESLPLMIPEEWLAEHGVKFWQDLPLTLSENDHADGLLRVSIGKAIAAGLTLRPWRETARDTHAWSLEAADQPKRHGMDSGREAQVLAAWGGRAQSG